ncbi:acyltransferase [Sphingobacterium thalpophilum]|uniref:Acyltransferase n=1 Tax=Sphingobacterium thalpophilum TaxID=259 RepID=A0ABV4HBJ1_9SPHI
MTASKRIFQIDLFRFIAASAVLLYHYLYRGYKAGNMSLLRFDGVGEYFKYGYLGVDLFFMISGFVIAFSIKHLSLSKFCYSRFRRLYPIYWLCLLLTCGATYFWGAPRYQVTFSQLLANLTMAQKLFGVGDIDGAYWSLYVELKFYLIIAIFLIINRFKKISLDYLVCGWLLLYCLYLSIDGAVGRIHWLERTFHSDFSPYIIGSTLVLFYALMLLVSCNRLEGLNSAKWVKVGMLTYPLYLIHQHIGFILFNHLHPYLNKYMLVTSVTLLMLAVAYFLSEWAEPRIMKRFNRI